ncbi:unnamed protein product [Rhizophagus irregularis]|nr:unnamed protein product [Rhizophagus irregularis]
MTTKRKLPNKSSDDNQEMEVEGGSKRKQITKKEEILTLRRPIKVVVVSEKSSNDDDDDDDVGKTEDHKKPEVFQSKSNLEIVAWLVDHPEILRLALEMNKTDVAISSSSKITDDKIRLWDESIKCLFLRARSPRGEVFDELITKISKLKYTQTKLKSIYRKFISKELIDYVDEEFVQKILSRQLVAVNISELTRNGGSGNKIVDSLSL